jgi:hypothetical protein
MGLTVSILYHAEEKEALLIRFSSGIDQNKSITCKHTAFSIRWTPQCKRTRQMTSRLLKNSLRLDPFLAVCLWVPLTALNME